VRFTRGDVFLAPTDRPYTVDMHDCKFALLRVSRPVADDLAAEHTGLPAADLRFESIAAVSASARVLWSRTVAFICRQLLGSGITETSAIMAHEMTRLAAAALLETFPDTTMTAAYIRARAACHRRRCAALRHSSTTMPGRPSLCPRSPRPQA
jgi:hypothetical protein